MAKLTIDQAAFHGFGLVKRDPLTFLGVAIMLALLGGALWAVLVPAYAQFFQLVADTPKGQEADPEVVLQAMSSFFGAMGLLYLILIPAYAIVMGALYRSLIFGKSQGWVLGLKLGMDEVRAILVTFVGSIIALLPYLGVVLITAIVAAGAAGAAAAAGADENSAAVIAVFAIFIGYGIGIVLTIWVCIRLSYAAPASVGERRFVIFESWGMTRGSFWTLFLSYLIVYLIVAVIETVIIYAAFAASAGWLATIDWENPDFSAFQTVSIGPALIIGSIVYGLVATFVGGAFMGVASRGYLAWKEGQGQRQEPT